MFFQGEKKVATIQNVFAVIKGIEEPDRYVLLGNHRDAWTYGAVDPSSGTAALLDVARGFSVLLGSGWKPRRTIILCSWDAEEFGMVGSISLLTTYMLVLFSNTYKCVDSNMVVVIFVFFESPINGFIFPHILGSPTTSNTKFEVHMLGGNLGLM